MNVVIVGGGFGGIKTALELSRQKKIKVTLISDRNYFVYYPTMYAVATGFSTKSSFTPLREIFKGTSVKIVKDEILHYDPRRKTVSSKGKTYSYDKVVFAMGVVTSYFGIKGLDRYSYGIKSRDELIRFRSHIHHELLHTKHLNKKYFIVGAGPTGVELAASLTYYIKAIKVGHKLENRNIEIILVEASPRILPRMSEQASSIVFRHLQKLGIKVMVNERVEWQDDDEVSISGRSYPTETVVWTSGVSNHPFFKRHEHHFEIAPNGRVIVDDNLMSEQNTYVIGDNAATPYSGLAQIAIHDAIYVSKDILSQLNHKKRHTYSVKTPPVVLPVGKRWAIMEWKWLRLSGVLAYLVRLAADFIGYHDVFPIGLAIGKWRSTNELDQSCKVCGQTRV